MIRSVNILIVYVTIEKKSFVKIEKSHINTKIGRVTFTTTVYHQFSCRICNTIKYLKHKNTT